MTTEELQRLANDMADSECLHIPTSTNAVLGIARELIAARRVVEAAKTLCDRVEQQQNGWPMRADYVPNALRPTQDALSAYEEAKA